MRPSNQFLFAGLLIISLILIPYFNSSRSQVAPLTADQKPYFCAGGDWTSKAVRDAMKKLDCFANVLLGDYYGKEKDFVKGFIESPNTVPVIAATGNHDKCDNVIKVDNIKGNKCTYGLKVRNIGFIVVDTNSKISGQVTEINRLAKKFQADPAIDFIVIVQHKVAVISPGAHHKETEVKGDRELYADMKSKYSKFVAIFQGHEHGFEECDPADIPGVHVVTDGMGGRDPYPWGTEHDDGCKNQLSGSKFNGFTEVFVSPEGLEPHHIVAK